MELPLHNTTPKRTRTWSLVLLLGAAVGSTTHFAERDHYRSQAGWIDDTLAEVDKLPQRVRDNVAQELSELAKQARNEKMQQVGYTVTVSFTPDGEPLETKVQPLPESSEMLSKKELQHAAGFRYRVPGKRETFTVETFKDPLAHLPIRSKNLITVHYLLFTAKDVHRQRAIYVTESSGSVTGVTEKTPDRRCSISLIMGNVHCYGKNKDRPFNYAAHVDRFHTAKKQHEIVQKVRKYTPQKKP